MEEEKISTHKTELERLKGISVDVHEFSNLKQTIKEIGISIEASIEEYMKQIGGLENGIKFSIDQIKDQDWFTEDPLYSVYENQSGVRDVLLGVIQLLNIKIMYQEIITNKADILIELSKKNSEYKIKAETQKSAIEWAVTMFKGVQEEDKKYMFEQLEKERKRTDSIVDKTLDKLDDFKAEFEKLKKIYEEKADKKGGAATTNKSSELETLWLSDMTDEEKSDIKKAIEEKQLDTKKIVLERINGEVNIKKKKK